MGFYLIKSTGEQELFDGEKFKRSLAKSGAPSELIDAIHNAILSRTDLRTTKAIYRYALQELKKQGVLSAGRYSLKHALMALGPAGFPFEKYAAKLFEQMGFETTLNQIVKGQCVEHEIDFIAQKDNRQLMVECKFHNALHLKSDLKVALYVQARLHDIEKYWKNTPYHANEQREAWIVSNTKFSTQAVRYAECSGLHLLGWGYPLHKSLPDFIHEVGLHPITALLHLKHRHKRDLIKHGIVLCRDIIKDGSAMKSIGMTNLEIELALQEARALCATETSL